MAKNAIQAGILLIDDYIFADESGILSSFKQFIDALAAKFETPIYGVLLTRSRTRARNPTYQECLGPNVKLISALVLPAAGEAERGVDWANFFSAGLEELIASMPVRKGLVVGMWYYIDGRSRMYGQPLELVYWVLLFTGFNPLFLRRLVYFRGDFIECPSCPSAPDIFVRRGKDYRDILLMSLASIRCGVYCKPYTIAKAIEEVLGGLEYGSADSLRKTVRSVLHQAESYCLVSPEGGPPAYTISPFGELLLNVLLSNNLIKYIMPSKTATFIMHVRSKSGLE